MRSEGFKGISLAMLIILSLLVPLVFFGNPSSKIVHASPDGGSIGPIEIKVKVFVLQGREDVTDGVIDGRMDEADEALRNSGIRLVRGPICRGFPGNARSRENRDKLRENVENEMKREGFKGVALIIAHENSIDDNENKLGVAIKGNRASAIVADNAEIDMGTKVWDMK